ncbi:MAG: OsmC family protein [Pseudomonadales bacterium]|nr:OsmC family protein [Pseudomonadales bacterium]
MKARIKWVEEVTFMAESGSGHAVVVDGPPDHGGRNLGPRPMEMLLMGLGACSSFDVVSILKKSRQQVVSCETELEATRADAVPAVFTAIHLRFIVKGYALKRQAVERAVELSAEKYCSASIMLVHAGVKITHEVTLVDMDTVEAESDH